MNQHHQQYQLPSAFKQKMKAFTNIIVAENSTRYSYIEMLQKSYGALLSEQSKTQHFCDICKKTILGKAFGPHKKSHYKNGDGQRHQSGHININNTNNTNNI